MLVVTQMRSHTLIVLALAACGEDANGPPGDVPHPACPEYVHASFVIWGEPVPESFMGTYDDWGRASAADPGDGCFTDSVDNDGDAPGPCGGECSSDEVCYQKQCVSRPRALDIGPLRVDGIDTPVTLTPFPDNAYASHVTYQPGAEITVSGGGEGTGVEPFEIRTRGVPTLTVPSDALTYTAEGDLVVTWDPADSPPGTRVVFRALSGGFSEYHLECWSDDTGQLTVPADDLVSVDEIVLLERQTVGTGETELGCGRLTTFSRVDLDP